MPLTEREQKAEQHLEKSHGHLKRFNGKCKSYLTRGAASQKCKSYLTRVAASQNAAENPQLQQGFAASSPRAFRDDSRKGFSGKQLRTEPVKGAA